MEETISGDEVEHSVRVSKRRRIYSHHYNVTSVRALMDALSGLSPDADVRLEVHGSSHDLDRVSLMRSGKVLLRASE